MKNLRSILFTAVLFVISNNVCAQTDTTNTQILMRTFEFFTGVYSSEIVIAYGNSKTERIELESLKPKNWDKNASRINYVINKIKKSGYKLVSHHGGGDINLQTATYLFVKE